MSRNCNVLRLVFCVFFSVVALGQSSPTSSTQTTTPSQKIPTVHEQVEVTATRVPEDAEEVPAAIEVFSGEELRQRGARDLRSALSGAIGVDIAPGGDNGPAGYVPDFWGLKEFDAFLLVVDGVPWGGAYNPALTSLNLNDVERIEVMRGPAPITYGAALDGTQLNATVNVTGRLFYSPPAGAVLPVGAGQVLSVQFVPDDSVFYAAVIAHVKGDKNAE